MIPVRQLPFPCISSVVAIKLLLNFKNHVSKPYQSAERRIYFFGTVELKLSNSCSRAEEQVDISRELQHNFSNGKKIEKDHSMIETCGLKNIFLQTIISFVLSRKIIKSIKVT